MANVVPRMQGVVRKVNKNLGDTVRSGEVMAVIESRELADVRALFHAAMQRVELAEANYKREKRLWEKKITAEQEYLDARIALAEARIELASAEQKLLALGFSTKFLKDLPHDPNEILTEYEIIAESGATLQIDCPDLAMGRHMNSEGVSLEDFFLRPYRGVWRAGGRYRGAGIGLPAWRATSNQTSRAFSTSARASSAVAPKAEQASRSGMSAM